VAQDDQLNVERGQPESAHVVAQTIWGHTSVEEQVVVVTVAGDGNQHREPVLGQGDVVGFAGIEHIGR
jgi:hypothetical protein